MGGRGTYCDPVDRVLTELHNVEVLAARPTHRSVPYAGVEAFDWDAYTAHCCLAVFAASLFPFIATRFSVPEALNVI